MSCQYTLSCTSILSLLQLAMPTQIMTLIMISGFPLANPWPPSSKTGCPFLLAGSLFSLVLFRSKLLTLTSSLGSLLLHPCPCFYLWHPRPSNLSLMKSSLLIFFLRGHTSIFLESIPPVLNATLKVARPSDWLGGYHTLTLLWSSLTKSCHAETIQGPFLVNIQICHK